MYSKWRNISGILFAAACLVLVGCGSTSTTYVRTVNTSNGLTGYTVQVGQTGIVANVPYGTEGVTPKGQYSVLDSSGNYRPIGAGKNQTVIVYQAQGSAPMATAQHTFAKNAYSTVVTIAPAPSIGLLTLTDGDTAPSSGNFKVRLVHASPSIGAVDVYLTAQGGSVGGTPLISNFQFGQVTTQYFEHSAGAVEMQVTPHGNPSTVLYSGVFSATAAGIYTGFLLDPPANSGGPYSLLLVSDPTLTATTK